MGIVPHSLLKAEHATFMKAQKMLKAEHSVLNK
jgi:hypothetical protein